jgi:hypothetical protein
MGSALLGESVQVAAITVICSIHTERMLWERIVGLPCRYLCTKPAVLSTVILEGTSTLYNHKLINFAAILPVRWVTFAIPRFQLGSFRMDIPLIRWLM